MSQEESIFAIIAIDTGYLIGWIGQQIWLLSVIVELSQIVVLCALVANMEFWVSYVYCMEW